MSSAQSEIAKLDATQLEQLSALENKLGVVLIAYESSASEKS